ncbi:hypothetical protein HY489_01215 [Candidatus Woesearchaeota archaeon]|nr:hypothetical protein [Candidatus Woesearchaeota archaeon]
MKEGFVVFAVVLVAFVSFGVLLSSEPVNLVGMQGITERARTEHKIDGISIEQVDFDYAEGHVRYSPWGRFTVNSQIVLEQAGLKQGFLNMYTDAGWVVQNVYLNVADRSPVTAYFDLGNRFPTKIQRLRAFVMVTSGPSARFQDGQRITFLVSPVVEATGGVGEYEDRTSSPTGQAVRSSERIVTTEPSTRPLPAYDETMATRETEPVSYRPRPLPAYDETRRPYREVVEQVPYQPVPAYPKVVDVRPPYMISTWLDAFPTWTFTLPKPANVQAAKNQCVSMSVANSLQFLENNYGVQIPNKHVAGLKGDNSLVGQLDTEMGRQVTNRLQGSGLWFQPMLNGKFSYLSKNGLKDFFVHKHQGRGWGNANKGEALPAGDYTASGITSDDQGAVVTWEWICNEIKNGEDVELIYSREDATGSITGGHAVRVFECGMTFGVPWIGYLHDSDQNNDNKGLETVRMNVMDSDGDGLLNFGAATREVQFALSESVAPGMSISQAQPMTYAYESGTGWS